MIETNLFGPLRMIQGLVPSWRIRGSGVIVNVSSVQGRVATPLEGPYAASKHALEGMSETLHYEVAHFGIRVVIVEPGFIAPGMKHGDDHTGPPEYRQLWDEWSGTDTVLNGPDGRPGSELVAAAIADAIEQPDDTAAGGRGSRRGDDLRDARRPWATPTSRPPCAPRSGSRGDELTDAILLGRPPGPLRREPTVGPRPGALP